MPEQRVGLAGHAQPVQRPRFELVRRGYDRAAVDAFVEQIVAERASLRDELGSSERRRQQAEQHASATELENRTLRQAQAPASRSDDGFGLRFDKLIRLAEQEVAEARVAAAREASVLLEQARAAAEEHRHEVEQGLIARSSALEQQAAQRHVELQEREMQMAGQVAAARSEAAAVLDTVNRDAEQRRAQAEAAAADVRGRAASEARRLLGRARQEADRLTAAQGEAREEIARLLDILRGELGGRSVTAAGGRAVSIGGTLEATQAGPAAVADDRSCVTATTGR